jgi:hypothetical protein
MCKEMPVFPVTRVVAKEEERHKGSLTIVKIANYNLLQWLQQKLQIVICFSGCNKNILIVSGSATNEAISTQKEKEKS